MWVYLRSEKNEFGGLWTVGFYDPSGKWVPESDHPSAEEAAARVAYLNGNAAQGVPGWARPVLRELWNAVDASVRHASEEQIDRLDTRLRTAIAVALETGGNAGSTPAEPLRGSSSNDKGRGRSPVQDATYPAAALASDAGTPEGEPFFHRLGCPKISGRGTAAHCTCPREMRAMTDEEMSASQTAAPLAVSVKTYHHNIPTSDNPEDHSEGNCPCDPIVDEDAGTVTHQPMPALNAASGPDATFSRALFEYSAAVEDYARESLGWTWAQRERGMQRRVDCVSELWRLYRAATGEVVGRGEVVTVNPDLGSVEIELDGVMPVLPAVGTRVVLRREKEEG